MQAPDFSRTARKLVELDQQSAALQKEREATLAKYHKRIEELRTSAVPQLGLPGPSQNGAALTLRERINSFLTDRPDVPTSLDDIQAHVGSTYERRKVVWTLANMKRDGIIKREGRGLWSSEPQSRPKEENDPEF